MSLDIMSNMISSIKNAAMVKKPFVEVMHTKDCESVAKTLKASGFISDIKIFKESGKPFKRMRLELAYDSFGNSSFKDIQRVSKPGRRIYKKASELRKFMNGYGIRVVSTSRGVVSDVEARKRKLGGEIICEVF